MKDLVKKEENNNWTSKKELMDICKVIRHLNKLLVVLISKPVSILKIILRKVVIVTLKYFTMII